jgi:hypothetical protein
MTNSRLGTEILVPSFPRYTNNPTGTKDAAYIPLITACPSSSDRTGAFPFSIWNNGRSSRAGTQKRCMEIQSREVRTIRTWQRGADQQVY